MATTGSGTSSAAAAGAGSYTLAQLVTRWRQRLDDTLEPYLWSNDEFTEFADTLQKEVVAETPILEDRDDTTICTVSLVQGDGAIDLSTQRILSIQKAWVDGEYTPLELVTTEYMDANYGDWQGIDTAVTQDTPTILVYKGLGVNKAWLYPPLDSATGTLNLNVFRLPLLDLDYTTHSGEYLEIDKFAHLLTHGILWLAYMRQDAGLRSQQLAEQHRVYWEGQDGKGGDKEKIRRMVLRESPISGFPGMHEGLV